MKLNKTQKRDATAKEAERVSNEGHYLERLKNLAIVLECRETEMAVLALEQLYVFCKHKPTGADGIMGEISARLLIIAQRDWKFTKDQLNRLWYGVHFDSREMFGLKFPYDKKEITNKMLTDK